MSVEKFECFDVSIANQIAHICLNRPEKRNSMIPAFWDQLPAVVADIDANARARVIVISSTGPVFSAGMDLAAFTPRAAANEDEALTCQFFAELSSVRQLLCQTLLKSLRLSALFGVLQ